MVAFFSRCGRSSSHNLKKLLFDILKFSFHSSSTATPPLRLSHQSEVLPGLTQNLLRLLFFFTFPAFDRRALKPITLCRSLLLRWYILVAYVSNSKLIWYSVMAFKTRTMPQESCAASCVSISLLTVMTPPTVS